MADRRLPRLRSLARAPAVLLDAAMTRSFNWLQQRYHDPYAVPLHPDARMRERALEEACDYIEEHMPTALLISESERDGRMRLLDLAMRDVPPTGLIAEFGVYRGVSVNHIAERFEDRQVYGFDSFEGLPEDWSGTTIARGMFALDRLPRVHDNVELVVGWFDDTVPGFAREHAGEDVAFLHVDSDLYSSAKTVFDHLGEGIRPGTVIVFDEYFNYPGWRQHEHRAFQELCVERGLEYTYLAAFVHQVAVRIDAVGADDVTAKA